MQHLPRTMKAVLLLGHGGFEQLEYRENVPVPIPGAGEVLMRVAAAGVNNTDINTRKGLVSSCGRIVAVGSGVNRARLGERVLVEPVFHAAAGAIAGPVVTLDLRTLCLKDLRPIGCTVLEPPP